MIVGKIFFLPTGYQTFPRGYRALLEKGLSDVVMEIGQTREKTEKE